MRFWLGGPRIFGLRTGVSFGPSDFRKLKTRDSRASQQRAAGRQKVGFVYVIRGDHNLIKVGCSSNPKARIATLRTASPYPLAFDYLGVTTLELMLPVEQEAHRLLDKHRLNGEWFDCPAHLAVAALHGAAHSLGDAIVPTREIDVDHVLSVAGSVPDPQPMRAAAPPQPASVPPSSSDPYDYGGDVNTPPEPKGPPKLWAAYIWWLMFGLVGAHRLYIGQRKRALVPVGLIVAILVLSPFVPPNGHSELAPLAQAAFLAATLGFFGVWVADFFFLYSEVKTRAYADPNQDLPNTSATT